jgi:hypothetical protein
MSVDAEEVTPPEHGSAALAQQDVASADAGNDQVELDIVEHEVEESPLELLEESEPGAVAGAEREDGEDADPDISEFVTALDADDGQLDLIDEPVIEQHSIEDELDALEAAEPSNDSAHEDLGDMSDVEADTHSEVRHFVAPLTDEEQSINMMIDQELMALAVEDKDGFASTIVLPDDAFTADDFSAKKNDGDAHEQNSPGVKRPLSNTATAAAFEAIVLEGESVQSAYDPEKLETDQAAAAQSLQDASTSHEAPTSLTGRKRYGVIGGIAALVLLLLTQAIHQYRGALATIPTINDVLAPIYRALGQPLQPDWDIKGWRFEVTQGNTDVVPDNNSAADSEQIIVYSRIGNKSDQPLPYPLIGISLTDRFEETIGSRILEPAEYLPDDVDPRRMVHPGVNFNAVISIQTPPTDTAGFKLNVCYRMSAGNLRCAIEDFK